MSKRKLQELENIKEEEQDNKSEDEDEGQNEIVKVLKLQNEHEHEFLYHILERFILHNEYVFKLKMVENVMMNLIMMLKKNKRTRQPQFVIGERVKCTLKKHHKLFIGASLTIVGLTSSIVQCRDQNGVIAGIRKDNLVVAYGSFDEQNDLATNIVAIQGATIEGIQGPISVIAYRLDSFIHFNLQSADLKFIGSFSIPTYNRAGWTLEQVCYDDYCYVFKTNFKHLHPNNHIFETTVQVAISWKNYVKIFIFNPRFHFSCKFIPPKRLQQVIIDKTFLLSFD